MSKVNSLDYAVLSSTGTKLEELVTYGWSVEVLRDPASSLLTVCARSIDQAPNRNPIRMSTNLDRTHNFTSAYQYLIGRLHETVMLGRQSEDRVHRLGEPIPVTVRNYLTVDESVKVQLHHKKESMEITQKALRFMVRYGGKPILSSQEFMSQKKLEIEALYREAGVTAHVLHDTVNGKLYIDVEGFNIREGVRATNLLAVGEIFKTINATINVHREGALDKMDFYMLHMQE